MQELKIYTSEGRRFDVEARDGETKNLISRLFLGNVRLAIDFNRRSTTAWVFFWARQDRSSRSNQFYAEYKTDKDTDFFANLKQAVVQRVENELGMHLDTSKEAVQVFNQLDRPIRDFRESTTADFISDFINENQPLDFGTNDYRKALAITKMFYLQKSSGQLAICDNGRFDSIANYDLIIEYDSKFDDIQAIGETKELEKEKREELRDRQITDSLDKIESEVRTLRDEVGLSQSEIRNRLSNRLPGIVQQSQGQSEQSEHVSSQYSDSGSTSQYSSTDSTSKYSSSDSPLSASGRSRSSIGISLPNLNYSGIGAILGIVLLLSVIIFISGLAPMAAILPGDNGPSTPAINESTNNTTEPSQLNIHQPINNTIINDAIFYINGSTPHDELYINIQDTEENVTSGWGYYSTDDVEGDRREFNLTVGDGPQVDITLKTSSSYRIDIAPITARDDEGDPVRGGMIRIWIEYRFPDNG